MRHSSSIFPTIAMLVFAIIAPAVASQTPPGPERALPFTVTDSIELTSLVYFYDDTLPDGYGTVLPSPGGKYFLIHTRHGNVARNLNIQSLLLYERSDVETYLDAPQSAPPVAKVLITKSGSDPRDDSTGQIAQIRWTDASTVAFLARGANGYKQVMAVDAETANVRELTAHDTDVRAFSLLNDQLMFYANRPGGEGKLVRDLDHGMLPGLPSQLLQQHPLGSYIGAKALETPVELFKSSHGGEKPLRINMPITILTGSNDAIWQSPSGRYAITLDRAFHAPAHWADYKIPHPKGLTWPESSFYYYQLIDLENNAVRPLLDAPSGHDLFNGAPRKVFWLQDGGSVVVTNTFVPKTAAGAFADEQYLKQSALAEVNLNSGKTTLITFEPAKSWEAMAVIWREADQTLVVTRDSTSNGSVRGTFARTTDGWKKIASTSMPTKTETQLIALHQSLNERPRLFASNAGGKRKLLLDLNPQMDRHSLGRTEVIEWIDRNNLQWKAGLMLPPGYVKGRSYPLVAQTHGFVEDEYMVSGLAGYTSGYAAQPLANAGFAVLQIREPNAAQSVKDAKLCAQGYREIIGKLVALGIADLKGVGALGFSYTGLSVHYLLSEYPGLVAAAVISDGAVGGYAAAIMMPEYPGVFDSESGFVAPDLESIGDYFQQSPLYSIANSRTAIRFEAIGTGSSIPANWEYYFILRQARRPVDLVWFPQGTHDLMKPAEQFASQGGGVDWFRFWLKGEEDTDPVKVNRYKRWRQMRADWKKTAAGF